MLYQQGVHAAFLSRWSPQTRVKCASENRTSIPWGALSQLTSIYGPTSVFGNSILEIIIDGIKYRSTQKGKPDLDCDIGYISLDDGNTYAVGKISGILKVKTVKERKEEVVFLVRRYKPAPSCFSTYLWHNILAHRALGLRVVGTDTEKELQVVPTHNLIGHVAIGPLEKQQGKALMTIQLAKVVF